MSPSKSRGRTERRPRAEAAPQPVRVRWRRRNVGAFAAGLACVVVGYVLLSRGDITAAPALLVAGYCVLIPLAFIL